MINLTTGLDLTELPVERDDRARAAVHGFGLMLSAGEAVAAGTVRQEGDDLSLVPPRLCEQIARRLPRRCQP